ncbi:MAG: hypothetical protein HY918_02700 [Candidatus Doudnabacteria bacterium]|nr:hypothetical protein [Candidatus Doudnabacteria bacterium]
MFKAILLFHIFGALSIFGLMAGSLFAIYKKQEGKYASYAKAIGYNFGFQLISGSALTWLSLTQTSILTFCGKIAFYVLSVAVVEGILFYKMRGNTQNSFPAFAVFNSSALGLAAVILTIVFRF